MLPGEPFHRTLERPGRACGREGPAASAGFPRTACPATRHGFARLRSRRPASPCRRTAPGPLRGGTRPGRPPTRRGAPRPAGGRWTPCHTGNRAQALAHNRGHGRAAGRRRWRAARARRRHERPGLPRPSRAVPRPCVRPGDAPVTGNLGRHKAAGVRDAVEAAGASLLHLAPCPDLNPIGTAPAKLEAPLRAEAARTVEALWAAARARTHVLSSHEVESAVRATADPSFPRVGSTRRTRKRGAVVRCPTTPPAMRWTAPGCTRQLVRSRFQRSWRRLWRF